MPTRAIKVWNQSASAWENVGIQTPDTSIFLTTASAASVYAPINNPTLTGVLSVPDGSAASPSITNTGDTNTGVFFPDDDTVGIATGGSTRVTIGPTGILSIPGGTDVRLDIRRSNTGKAWSHDIRTIANFERGGDAGISITAANDKDSTIWFADTDTETAAGRLSYSHDSDALRFYVGGTTERMRITSTGRVGIGTSSPNSNLEVSVTGANRAVRLYNPDSTLSDGELAHAIEFTQNDNSSPDGTNAWIKTYATGSSGNLSMAFATGGNDSPPERMRITNTGNVGIGTSTPSSTLEVNGVAAFSDGSATAPSITNTGDTNTGIFHPAEDTVAISTGGTERVRVNDTGLVIGGATARSGLTVRATSNPGTLTLENSSTGNSAGTQLGAIDFYGNDSSADSAGVRVQIAAVAENTTSANGLVFYTTNASALTPTERVRVGSDGSLRIGNGKTSATPATGIIRGTSGSGTDIAGAELRISGGASTGSAAGGAVKIYTSPAGSSGSSANTLTERVKVDSNGLITGTGTSLGAWTAYTPTLGGTGWALGDGTVAFYYCQIGKVIHMRGRIVFGSTSTYGAAAALTISAPVTATSAGTNRPSLTLQYFDSSAGLFYLGLGRLSGSTITTYSSTNAVANLALTSATGPFSWASSDSIDVHGTYEIF